MAENSFLALVGLFGFTPDNLLKLPNASPGYAHPAALPAFLLASLSFGRLFLGHGLAMIPEQMGELGITDVKSSVVPVSPG